MIAKISSWFTLRDNKHQSTLMMFFHGKLNKAKGNHNMFMLRPNYELKLHPTFNKKIRKFTIIAYI